MGRPLNQKGESQEISPDFLKGRQTRDLVAEKAGFGSHVTRDDAARVLKNGILELAAMMDTELVSISVAGELARAPTDIQIKAVSEGPKAVKAETERAKKKRREAKKGKSRRTPTSPQIRTLATVGTDGRPVALNRFCLSLRSIYDSLIEMGKAPPELLAYAADNRAFLDHKVLSHVAEILSGIAELRR
jgi:hypothetical protein